MSVDHVGLKICLLKTSNSMVTLKKILGVNQSGPRTSSTPNHRYYMTLDNFMVRGVKALTGHHATKVINKLSLQWMTSQTYSVACLPKHWQRTPMKLPIMIRCWRYYTIDGVSSKVFCHASYAHKFSATLMKKFVIALTCCKMEIGVFTLVQASELLRFLYRSSKTAILQK